MTSDAGLLLPRELDGWLGLSILIERHLTDPRTRRNRQFPLPDLFRQSIYSRLPGYEETNDAERLAEDPTLRMLASRERREASVALTSTRHGFATDVRADGRNDPRLARRNTEWVQREATGLPTRRVTLDSDSSESPVHGAQEPSAYNGHCEAVCYHPLSVFNQHGDCLAAKRRPGNVHSADGWDEVRTPVIDRGRARGQTGVVRADAAVALPALHSALRNLGVPFGRKASFAGKALALARKAVSARPSPRALPRGAAAAPLELSPGLCALGGKVLLNFATHSMERWSDGAWRTPAASRPTPCWSGTSRTCSSGPAADPATPRWAATGPHRAERQVGERVTRLAI